MKCLLCEKDIPEHVEEICNEVVIDFISNNIGNMGHVCKKCREHLPDEFIFKSCSQCDIPLLHEVYIVESLGYNMELYIDTDNIFYCPDCWNDSVVFCSQCNNPYLHDHMNNCDCPNIHCVDCSCPSRLIGVQSSHSRPKVSHHGKPPYYGMELEIETLDDRNDVAEEMLANNTGFWCEEDGSLSDESGLEVCFEPRSMKSWKDYNDELANIIDIAKDHNGTAYNSINCGIHIHRNREDLNDIHISKLLVAIVKLRPYIVTIAQRHSSDYASFDYYSNTTDTYTMFYKSLKDGVYNSERFVALNLQNHETIEFRIFKSTLKQSTIYAYLAFCDTLTSWVGNVGFPKLISKYRRYLWVDYLNYVMETPHTFKKEYLNYMKHKKLLVQQKDGDDTGLFKYIINDT